MVLEQSRAQKRIMSEFQNRIFQFLAIFWVTKLKIFFAKVRQSLQNYLNQNLGIINLKENGFGESLSSKTNVVSVLTKHLPVLCKFLSDEVETILWESEAKHSKLFKSKFGHQNLLRKWFWSNLELKAEGCEPLKRAFFRFLQVSEWRKWNHFLRNLGKAFKTIQIKIWV